MKSGPLGGNIHLPNSGIRGGNNLEVPSSTFRPWGTKSLKKPVIHVEDKSESDVVWMKNQTEDSSNDTFNMLHKQPV